MTSDSNFPFSGHESSGEPSDEQSDQEDTGISTTTGRVEAYFSTVEVGNRATAGPAINVDAYALDDGGSVELSIETEFPVMIGLDPEPARELAEAIEIAAMKAEGDL
jgi:hypothetical protein